MSHCKSGIWPSFLCSSGHCFEVQGYCNGGRQTVLLPHKSENTGPRGPRTPSFHGLMSEIESRRSFNSGGKSVLHVHWSHTHISSEWKLMLQLKDFSPFPVLSMSSVSGPCFYQYRIKNITLSCEHMARITCCFLWSFYNLPSDTVKPLFITTDPC